MKKTLLIASALATLSIATLAQVPEEYTDFDNYSVSQGLSQISVISMLQDSRGYMWIGTRYGLNRFNGYEFEQYVNIPSDTLSLSDNFIKSLREAPDGSIWAGTVGALNRLNPYTGQSRRYPTIRRKGRAERDNTEVVADMCFSASGDTVYWGGTTGLWRLNLSTNEMSSCGIRSRVYSLAMSGTMVYAGSESGLIEYDTDSGEMSCYDMPYSGHQDQCKVVYKDSRGTIWLAGINTLNYFNKVEGRIIPIAEFEKTLSSSRGEIRALCEDHKGRILIARGNRIQRYDPASDTVFDIRRASGESLPDDSYETVLYDRTGNLWVGTYSHGLFLSNPFKKRFEYFNPESIDSQISTIGPIGPMAQKGDKVYMGTEMGGLIVFDKPTGSISQIRFESDPESYNENNVKSLCIIGDELYIGMYTGRLYCYDTETQRLVGSLFSPKYNEPIYSIVSDGADRLYLGSFSKNGVVQYDRSSGEVSRSELFDSADINAKIALTTNLLVSPDGAFYIGTKNNGLYVRDSSSFRRIDDAGRMISCIVEDPKGNIIVGSSDAGLSVVDGQTLSTRRVALGTEGIRDKVYSAVFDASGVLWVISNLGICRLNDRYEVERIYDSSHGIKISEYSNNSAFACADGDICIGGNNGFIVFNPSNLSDNTVSVPPMVERLKVNNATIEVNQNEELTLKSKENNIVLEYCALNYIDTEQNRYRCKLEGVNEDWVDMGPTNRIQYSSLRPGRYRFLLESCNNDGYWCSEPTICSFRIKSPFYLTGYAFILYLLIVSTAVFAVVMHRRTMRQYSEQIERKKRDEEIYNAKIDLFTNFSHEIKNPLSLIQAPIDEALESGDMEVLNEDTLRVMQNNVKRLLSLVNRILVLQRSDEGKLSVRVSRGDIVGFVQEMKIAFEEVARLHSVSLTFTSGALSGDIWYDRNLLESVFMNLLSNAFKYVPDGGQVSISLEMLPKSRLGELFPSPSLGLYTEAESYLLCRIEDSGPGVPEAERERIFQPFVQGSGSQEGFGIGLVFVKKIIDCHHGDICVRQSMLGGAEFDFVLPTGSAEYKDEEIIKCYQDSENIYRYKLEDETQEDNAEPSSEIAGQRVLVVEDNSELRAYICSRLRKHFVVLEASDGEEGLQIARDQIPDLILSDIMMPRKDGLQLCSELKSSPDTNHIPVILLTARTLVQQVNEGLNTGADDYVTKPFSMTALLSKIRNILDTKENIRRLYSGDLMIKNLGIDVTSSDEAFLKRLDEVVMDNLSNAEFNIDSFAEKLCVSRASLYRKLESITGMSPSKYICKVRLKLAARLLKETDKTIAEIGDIVGIPTPAHFSNLFKREYGVMPKEYRRS